MPRQRESAATARIARIARNAKTEWETFANAKFKKLPNAIWQELAKEKHQKLLLITSEK